MWKKHEEPRKEPPAAPQPVAEVETMSSKRSCIGASLTLKGELSGGEDLEVQGSIEGLLKLPDNSVTVGRTGRIKGDIHADTIRVYGSVEGDLFGGTQVIIHPSGNVHGNITAPQVGLEQGAKLKGSVDMDPRPHKHATSPKVVDTKVRAEENKLSSVKQASGQNGAPDAAR